MKTLIRSLLLLSLIVWLGAEIFFPVVAAVTFTQLRTDTHAAGQIVGGLLRILHAMGIVSGLVAIALLVLAPAWGIYRSRSTMLPLALLFLMLMLTSYSQFIIIPAMEADRAAAGGVIDAVPKTNAARMHFDALHNRSTWVEEAVLLMGIVVVALVAKAETAAAQT